jgi:hypothetical protein
MMRKAAITVLAVFSILSSQAWSKALATVGQENITTDDVSKIKKQFRNNNPGQDVPFSDEEILNQLIEIKLGLMDARLKAMDQTADAKESMEAALFNYYRSLMVDNAYKNKRFSKKEITDYYNANPMVKLQRLAITFPSGDTKEAQKAYMDISMMRTDIKAKKLTFERAIEKVAGSSDANGLSGTFDNVPLPALNIYEASELRTIAPMEISTIITGNNFVSILRLIKVHNKGQDRLF